MAQHLVERYGDRWHGVLSCYDRIVVTGTLPQACYAAEMTGFLSARGIRIFDYARFAEPLCDAIRARAQELAVAAGIAIEHLAAAHIRKEDVAAKVIARRGDHPGLVHVISAMEACASYKPWHDDAFGVIPLLELHEAPHHRGQFLCEGLNSALDDASCFGGHPLARRASSRFLASLLDGTSPNGSSPISRIGLRQFSMNWRNAPLLARSPTRPSSTFTSRS